MAIEATMAIRKRRLSVGMGYLSSGQGTGSMPPGWKG